MDILTSIFAPLFEPICAPSINGDTLLINGDVLLMNGQTVINSLGD